MQINSMFHKTPYLLFFVTLIFTYFVHEAYPQIRTKQDVSLEEQQEGRSTIVLGSTMFGLFLYGPGTAILLDIEEANRIAGLELIIGGGSFVGALQVTKNHRLGAGRSNLILAGSWAGALYGAGVPVLFESENEKAYVACTMFATPIGGLLAHKLSSHRWFEKGESYLMSSGGLVGGLYGVAIPYLVNIENREDVTQAKIYVASAMIGVPAGVWTTTKLIYNKPISEGRSSLIQFGGLIGTAYANGITSLADPESPRAYVLASMLGLPVGTYLGYQLTAEDEYTPGRAALIQLGGFVGALFGTGVVLLADADEAANHKPYVVANILGSAVGIWIAHNSTRGWGEKIPFARASLIRPSEKVTVSLPSTNEWLTYGLMMLRKPTFTADFPVELVRISF